MLLLYLIETIKSLGTVELWATLLISPKMQATQRSCASNLAPRLMGGIQERITKSRTRNRQRHLAGSP